jgi:hypothetical protein
MSAPQAPAAFGFGLRTPDLGRRTFFRDRRRTRFTIYPSAFNLSLHHTSLYVLAIEIKRHPVPGVLGFAWTDFSRWSC